MKLEWTLAALVAGGATPADAAETRPPSTDVVAVNFSQDIGWSGTVAIEVRRKGESSIFANFNDEGRPEIGLWRSPVTAASFEQLLAHLRASGYQQLVSPAVVPPGTKLVSIGERLLGQDLPVMRSFPSVPAPVAPVVAFLDGLRSEIRRHPLRVLRGGASWRSSEVARGEDAVLEVTLTNIGTQPLDLANPLADGGTGWNGLRLVFGKGQGGGEQQQDLTPADLRCAPDTNRSATVLLAPGQTLRFEVRKKIDLLAGRHAARFEYHSLGNHDGDTQFVGGVLWVEPGELTVKKGPWWKFW